MQIKLIRTLQFFKLLTSTKNEIPKITSFGSPEEQSNVSDPALETRRRAIQTGITENHLIAWEAA